MYMKLTDILLYYNFLFKKYMIKIPKEKIKVKQLIKDLNTGGSKHSLDVYYKIYNYYLTKYVSENKTFIDLGSAPGGFSKFMLDNKLQGISVTLDESINSSLKMLFKHANIIYKNIFDIDKDFIDKNLLKYGTVDFVNCGAVIYDNQKLHSQLFVHQLFIAHHCLRKGGKFMFITDIFNFVYWSINTLFVICKHMPNCKIHIIPNPISFVSSKVYVLVENANIELDFVREICETLRSYPLYPTKKSYFEKIDKIMNNVDTHSLLESYKIWKTNTQNKILTKKIDKIDRIEFNEKHKKLQNTYKPHYVKCPVCKIEKTTIKQIDAVIHYNYLFESYISQHKNNTDAKSIVRLLQRLNMNTNVHDIMSYYVIYNEFLKKFVKKGETFIDLGSAPGGFSKFAIDNGLSGIALTLNENAKTAIKMLYKNDALKLLYKDLLTIDNKFIDDNFDTNVDFINCGAVIYTNVKLHSVLLISQLYIALKCLKKGGTIMFILDMFQYIYMSIEILNIFAIHCQECTFYIVPTPISFKKSQVYIVVKNVTLTNQIVRKICRILRKYIYIVSKKKYFDKLDRVFNKLNVESLFVAYDLYKKNTRMIMFSKKIKKNNMKIYNENYKSYGVTREKHITNCLVCKKD